MKKQGFTLIELLVSIVLFGLIATLLFGTLENLRHQLSFLKSKESLISGKNSTLSLMRHDFDRPKNLALTTTLNKEFSTASITGSNHSLYGTTYPYVVWTVLKYNNTLVRLESARPITLPIHPDALYTVKSDIIGDECELFRIYEEAKHRLIYLKFAHQAPMIVEAAR